MDKTHILTNLPRLTISTFIFLFITVTNQHMYRILGHCAPDGKIQSDDDDDRKDDTEEDAEDDDDDDCAT